jgi:thiol-disulfide isomerase/thioredoxin
MNPGRRRLLAIGVGAGAALTGAGLAWHRWNAPPDCDSFDELWAMRFDKPEGGQLVMANFRGKPLLINFWATWCVPCIRELPALQRFQRDYSARGWQVLALAVDTPVPVLEFIARFKLDLTVAMAGIGGMELLRSLGNLQGALPFSVAIDAGGQIRHRRLGESKYEELASWASGS